ncbi:unnamed protein product, partial [Trichobilharzia regenti]
NLTANSSSSNGNVTDVVHQTPVSSSSQLLASSSLKKDTVNSDSTNIGDHQNDGSHGDGDGDKPLVIRECNKNFKQSNINSNSYNNNNNNSSNAEVS